MTSDLPSAVDPASYGRTAQLALAQCLQGERLQARGDLHGAVHQYQQALKLDPSCYQAFNNLGNIFASLSDWNIAQTFFEAALRLSFGSAAIHNNLANVLLKLDQPHAAIQNYRQALTLHPADPALYHNLGNALCGIEQWSQAEAALHHALLLKPDYPEAHASLGKLFHDQSHFEQAEHQYRQAILLKPDFALAHTCLGQLLLRKCDFKEGWQEYEWRWRWDGFSSPKRNFIQSQWQGEPLEGRHILLHAEQGFGDTIQFLRYVQLVTDRGGMVTLEVHPELLGLARNVYPRVTVIARGDTLPAFDYHCPLLSLPFALSMAEPMIPQTMQFAAFHQSCPAWLTRNPGHLHAGLVWGGSPANSVDRRRSVPLHLLAPLNQLANVRFYALQPDAERQNAMNKFPFAAMLPAKATFEETASAIAHLDLVIAMDTAVAHLAGAMGKPVWILLPRVPDWRWQENRSDCPWYPSATLFRQHTAGDWQPVIRSVRDNLQLRSEIIVQ